MMSAPQPPTSKAEPTVISSQGLSDWLAVQRVSLALTTYQAGRLFFIGRRPDGGIRAHERLIDQCQGLWTDGTSLWTSGKSKLWRFHNDLPEGVRTERGADRRFAPREARITGAIDVHDIGVGDVGDGLVQPIFVATRFNCLATISDVASFRPLWRPPFVSKLIGEDRCHLNGLAMDGRRPAFVSAVSRSDVADGWRERRRDGGIVMEVSSGEIVASGLSMPHSPRLYDGRLWVLDSGRGLFGTIDRSTGAFTEIAFCPGYARGLAFVGRYAVIGLSRPRRNLTFEGLELDDRLAVRDAAPRCGLLIVDIDKGEAVQWLRFQHTIDELYDVASLPGVMQAEAVSLIGDGIEAVVPEARSAPDFSPTPSRKSPSRREALPRPDDPW
jgi:uncharacterized protein (TIGR03032 family)